MKALVAFAFSLFCAGCIYEASLSDPGEVPLDSALLGSWKVEKPAKGEVGGVRIFKWSGNGYVVHQFSNADHLYYRAYPIEIGGVGCVQLQLIGSDEGPADPDDEDFKPYQVVSYQLDGEKLTVRNLNRKLVDPALANRKALREAFLKNKGAKDLFVEPSVYLKATE